MDERHNTAGQNDKELKEQISNPARFAGFLHVMDPAVSL